MTRVAGATAVACAALLLVAGCSSGGDDSTGSAGSAASSADPAKIPGLVLDKADLPAGYQPMDVPKDQLQEMADGLSSSADNAEVRPAECKPASVFPAGSKLDEVGSTFAMKATSMLAETVAATGEQVSAIRDRAEGKCAAMTITIKQGPAAGAKAKSTMSVVDGPKTAADESVVVEQKSTIDLNGTTTKTRVIIGVAEVNGYTVSVQTSDGAGGAPDLAAFNDFFAKAVAKVAKQTS